MLINIRANWQSAKNGMNSVIKHASGLGNRLSGAFASAKNALGSVAGMMGVGLGAAAAVNGMKKLIDKMDEIEDNAPKLGVSFAYFQKMQFAAERSGTSFQAVTSGFTKIKKLAGEAAAGLRSGTDAFATIGLSAQQLQGMNTEQIFEEVTKRLNAMEDPMLRDAAASALFGKNFTELNNFLADHIELGKELEARGGVISDEHILAASAYKDVISNIGFSLQAWAVNSGFIVQLAKIAEGLDAITTNSKKMEKLGTTNKALDEYDANEGKVKWFFRKALNQASGLGIVGEMLGLNDKIGFNLGDKLFRRPTGDEYETIAAPTQADKDARRKEMGLDAARKKEVNSAAAKEAALNAAQTEKARAARGGEKPDADDQASQFFSSLKKEKAIGSELGNFFGGVDKADAKLKKAQEAMKAGANGSNGAGNAATTSPASTAADMSDTLRRIGGYSGATPAQGDRAAMMAKKQVDILSQVDSKLAVLENAARTGGMIFP